MAHPYQQHFVQSVKKIVPAFFTNQRVLEIGSLDINGSVRSHFDRCDYIGIDVAVGPGVDVVCQGQDFAEPDGSFDTVISCEVMEHNPYWKATFHNMIRLCRPGGLVIMTCATTGREEHGTTQSTPRDSSLTIDLGWEYYKNVTAADLRRAVNLDSLFSCWMAVPNYAFCDLYFAGFKAGAPPPVQSASALSWMRRGYMISNIRRWQPLRKQILMAVFGEKKYMSGPIRPHFARLKQ